MIRQFSNYLREHARAGREFSSFAVFGRVVRDTAAARGEDHPRRAERVQELGVVKGAERQARFLPRWPFGSVKPPSSAISISRATGALR